MKKIEAMRLEQKGKEFFLITADPRQIIKLVNIPNKDEIQDFQRPWKENRVKALSRYTAGEDSFDKKNKNDTKKAKGWLPTCPVLSLKNKLSIHKENEKYILEFPETQEEFSQCKGSIDILDGQHRLIAFNEKYLSPSFKDNDTYLMGFVVFQELTNDEKIELFIVTNERAEKVDKTVLHNMMDWLGVLSPDERKYSEILRALNREDISPLHNRINLDGHKMTNSIKSLQLKAVLNKSGTYEQLKTQDSIKIAKVISEYLTAWEKVFNISFAQTKNIDTLCKIAGLRFIFNIFPTIVSLTKSDNNKFSCKNIIPYIEIIKDKIWDNIDSETRSSYFRGDTATVKFAKETAKELQALHDQDSSTIDIFDI